MNNSEMLCDIVIFIDKELNVWWKSLCEYVSGKEKKNKFDINFWLSYISPRISHRHG